MEKQTRAKSNHPISSFSATAASVAALLSVVWIIVPAPSYRVWIFSVAASEWSFIFGALAVFGIFGGLIFGRGRVKFAAVSIGALALLISLYPFFSALSAARKHDVSLSFGQYAAGFWNGNNNDEQNDKKTFTFADIDGKPLRLDVYAPPKNTEKNGAGIIVVHGGSWNAGGRGDFPQWNRWLAANGYTVFDIDYRLAPQPNYLTATGDVKCAVLRVKRNAARFGISPDKIVLLGRSAGAHLALLAAYSEDGARLSSSCADGEFDENTHANENVRGVVSFYAPVDLIWSFDNPANERVINGKKTLAQFIGGSPHESAEIHERFLLASPGSHVGNQTPPTLLIHGGQDQLVRSENMDLLAERLKEANAPHKTLFISYAQHGFDYNFNGWGAQVVQPVLLDFLRENTKSGK
ncbi:MAG TPA: alpha/beta hydrolase [Pyrinomonadaceae bacterium]|nr:alpha/beta hydrolase [Pyrinomonadaceae bacterium]